MPQDSSLSHPKSFDYCFQGGSFHLRFLGLVATKKIRNALSPVWSEVKINLLHCVALIRSTSVTNQILLSEKLQVGQIERGVFQEETSARNAKNTLLIAQ